MNKFLKRTRTSWQAVETDMTYRLGSVIFSGDKELIIDAAVFRAVLETIMSVLVSRPAKVNAFYGGDPVIVSLFISCSWLKIRISDDLVLKIELKKVR